ncbi:MAG: DUF4352 domain-containing protein [Streptococcaceae bacterium]|jgi:hypothetical protein|nr:DUF4352 domain-containing protein [Streptococcaceae bacterium]
MKKLCLLAVAATLGITLSACSSSSAPTKVSSEKPAASSKAKVENKTFNVGDTVEIDGVHLKVNSVSFEDGSEYNEPDTGKKFVVVNVTITNKSTKNTSYNPYDFKLDDLGNQTHLDDYLHDMETLSSGSLAENGSVTGNLIGQAKVEDKLKLIYTGNMFTEEEKVTFNLN